VYWISYCPQADYILPMLPYHVKGTANQTGKMHAGTYWRWQPTAAEKVGYGVTKIVAQLYWLPTDQHNEQYIYNHG